MINRMIDFFNKQPTKAIQPDNAIAEKASFNCRLMALERQIAELRGKVEALSQPQDTRNWDAFKVPSNLPTYHHENKIGRFPSDIQADKTMVGDDK
jgi:hypothetical protein